jgi:hypothetical protein
MKIRIETKLAGLPFEQIISISDEELNLFDKELLQSVVERNIVQAERDFLSMIYHFGVKGYNEKLSPTK